MPRVAKPRLRPMSLPKLLSKSLASGRVKRQSKWSVAITAFELSRGIAQIIIVFRVLGRESYGVLVPIYYVTGLLQAGLSVLSDQAITTYAARALADGRPREASLILWSNVKLSFVLGLATYFSVATLAFAIPGLIGVDAEHRHLLLVFGLTALFLANQKDYLAVLRLADRYSYAFVVAVVTGVVQLGALVAIWLTGGSLWLVVLIATGAAAVNGLGMFTAALSAARKIGLSGPLSGMSFREMPSDMAKFLRASFWQTKAGALGWHLDPILTAKLGTDAQAGLYGLVRRVTDTLDSLSRTVGQVIQTEYSRRWFGSTGDGVRSLWSRSTVALAAAALAICGGIFVFRDTVAKLLGEEFAGAGGATTLAWVLPGAFAFLASTAAQMLPASVGKVWPSFVWNAVAVLVQVLAIFLFVPEFGANGAAFSRTLFYLSLTAVAIPFVVPVLRQNRRPEAVSIS